MIFRVIGGSVVYGFALYGAAQLVNRSRKDRLSKNVSGGQGDGKVGDFTADMVDVLGTVEGAPVDAGAVREAVDVGSWQ